MSNNNLSPTTRALLDAAKSDGPSRERRAAMWTGVTGGLVTQTPPQIDTGAKPQGAGASGNTAAATKGAFWAGASMKGAFIGALFGSAISIGVATFMLRAKPAPTAPLPAPIAALPSPNAGTNVSPNGNGNANASQNGAASNGATAIELPATNDANAQSTGNSAGSSASQSTGGSVDSTRSALASKSSSHATHGAKKDSITDESLDDMLSRETALVAEARRELLTGDAAGALKSVRAARALEARQFEPEEMSLEAKALRALGRNAEAERVESLLRTMYPGR